MTTIRDPSAESVMEPAAPFRRQRTLEGRAIEIEETSGTVFAEENRRVAPAPAGGARAPAIAAGLAMLVFGAGLAVMAGRSLAPTRRKTRSLAPAEGCLGSAGRGA